MKNRIVRAIAGSFILISLLLAIYVHLNWLWFTAFVGANLLQSSITKWCLLEDILKYFGVKDWFHWPCKLDSIEIRELCTHNWLGIWVNESCRWYWGRDAKETWALVTVLIYGFILHFRLIPKWTGLFAYNVATIYGLSSVIMTYYGANDYLPGLHSYATGDSTPIPSRSMQG